MRNDRARVVIDKAAGGRIASLQIDGVDMLVDRHDDPVMWGCYPMVPFAGRVRHGEFTFAGTDYALPKNFGDHAMHGFGFTRPWTQIDDDAIGLEFGELWPFAGRVQQHFGLRDTALTLTMTATADQPQPMMLGWHPWFRKSTTAGDAELSFAPTAMFERGDDGLPTGEIIEPPARPWDDCFVGARQPPSLTWGDLHLELRSDASHWVVFDELDHAICVEPQTGPPNAINANPTVLDAGEQLVLTLSMNWS